MPRPVEDVLPFNSHDPELRHSIAHVVQDMLNSRPATPQPQVHVADKMPQSVAERDAQIGVIVVVLRFLLFEHAALQRGACMPYQPLDTLHSPQINAALL